jgi:hypothetical protein
MQIPEIINAVPERTRRFQHFFNWDGDTVTDNQGRGLGIVPGTKDHPRETLEHLIMYSIQQPETLTSPTGTFRSKAEVKLFQSMYQDLEQAAHKYLKRFPVPPGGYELLRAEVDRVTPDSVEITVKPDAQGKPVVIGTKTAPPTPAAPTTTPSKSGRDWIKNKFDTLAPVPPNTNNVPSKDWVKKRFG